MDAAARPALSQFTCLLADTEPPIIDALSRSPAKGTCRPLLRAYCLSMSTTLIGSSDKQTLAEKDAAELAEVTAVEQAVLAVSRQGQPASAEAMHEAVRAELGYLVQHAVIRAAILRLLLSGDLTL